MAAREIVSDLGRFPSLGQLLEAFFAPPGAPAEVRNDCQDAWKAHCYNQDFPIYECWTSDYIDALARYLLECRQRYANECAEGKPLRVLEAGAGTGKLTFGLRQALARWQQGRGDEHCGIVIEAVDNSERPMKRLFPDVVREADYREALRETDYTIVLCAWMPFGADWTSDFRGKASVKEYILIGHTGDGLNGDPLRTWGYRKLAYEDESEDEDEDEDDEQVEGYIAESERAYAKDGFERVDLPHLSKWQLCRFDNVSSLSGQTGSSRTTSFRRK